MFRNVIAPALLGVVLAMPAMAQDLPKVESIDVSVELTAVQNPAAAAFWKTLETDLEGALAAQLVDRIGDEGMRLEVDVSEVELATAFETAAGIDQSMLKAVVNVMDDKDNTNFRTFDLTVSMEQAMPLIPEGVDVTVLTPSSAEVYSALVTSFATETVKRIDG